jgi:NAD(P)-dependent dehydrogenase (short-subunit alcohol dehydrogenase family)
MPSTAMIIGATGGIGGACARSLHARGWSLLLTGRRAEPLAALATELDARHTAGDANDEAVLQRLAEGIDTIDMLVHAAGILQGAPVRDQPVEQFDEVVASNLRSAYVAVRACLPRMSAGARIVLVSSTSATRPMRGLSAYSAAKAGMNAFAGALAAELEPEGINVSLVSPGPVDTAMMGASVNEFPSLPASDVGEVVGWLSELPPRMVVPDVLFRAPLRGPFAKMAGGGGTQGQDLSALRSTKEAS